MIRQNLLYESGDARILERLQSGSVNFPRHAVVAAILLVALLAFEVFNFDTTRYALENLLGPVSFAGLGWATVLAIAFCAIDFAGLVRLFTPDDDGEPPREVWYLMGAWLLGATMNAVMTWWAVSLTLLNHEFGNEVLTRAQLLQYVPVFVAILVWLTRILFIGALTMAGGQILAVTNESESASRARSLPLPTGRPLRERDVARSRYRANDAYWAETEASHAAYPHTSDEVPPFLSNRYERAAVESPKKSREEKYVESDQKANPEQEESVARPSQDHSRRVRQRPPLPGRRSANAIANGTSRRDK